MTGKAQPQREKIYERLGHNPIASDGIRPGGLTLTQRLFDLADFLPGSRILDAGCGSGVTLRYIGHRRNDLQIFGIDSSLELSRMAKDAHQAQRIVNADIGALPMKDGSFEGVISECCLSVMSYSRGHLEELFRVLKPGGKLLVSDVYLRNVCELGERSEIVQGCCLFGATTRTNSMNLLEKCGFRISIWEDHSQLLKDFAVRWILENGSMNEFWNLMTAKQKETACMRDRIRDSRPGYYLLVAHKDFSEPQEKNEGPA